MTTGEVGATAGRKDDGKVENQRLKVIVALLELETKIVIFTIQVKRS